MTCKCALEIRILSTCIIRQEPTAIGAVGTGYADLASFAAPELPKQRAGSGTSLEGAVEDHGGRLWATAEEGAGTAFHFTT
jgi:hypothetical protein